MTTYTVFVDGDRHHGGESGRCKLGVGLGALLLDAEFGANPGLPVCMNPWNGPAI